MFKLITGDLYNKNKYKQISLYTDGINLVSTYLLESQIRSL